MTVQPIEYGDNGKIAREKINAMLQEVEANIPSIWENNHWYLWDTDTGIDATWPKGEDWEPWKDGKTPVKWVDYFTEQDIESLNIPEKVSDLENDTGFITDSDLPTNLSDLHNDVWFITNLVENLVNYYKKSETFTKSEIESLIGWIVGVKFEVVQTLPASWENGTIYLISNGGTGSNLYDEYIWLSSQTRFEKIWTTDIDLSNYFNTQTQNSDAITEWNTNLFMTNTERAKLQNQSWTNTGDETQATIKSKLWKASANQDGYLSREDWIKFNNGWGGSGSWDVIWPDWANNWNVAVYNWNTGKLIKDWGKLNSIAFSWLTSDMAGDNIEITGRWSSGETAIKEWVDSINISDGVNDGLISFKTYWWTKQVSQEPILPAGYTQLEYIEANGTQYIVTDYYPNNKTEVDTKTYITDIGSSIFATRWTQSPTYDTFGIYSNVNNGFMAYYGRYNAKKYQTITWVAYNQLHTIHFWVNSIEIDWTSYSAPRYTFTSTAPLTIGGFYSQGEVGNIMKGRLYDTKIVEDWNIVHNYITAKNSEWEIWMYDLVSQTFLTNSGTGTFVAWPEVIVEVPEWYTILEYLQASGNQYLDLGFPLVDDDEIELEAKIDTIGSSTQNIFWGRTQGAENNIEIIISQGRWMIDWNNSTNSTYRLTVNATTDKTRFVLNKNRRAIYTGDTLLGEQVLTCPDSITTLWTFLFFVKGGTLAATGKFTGKVYSLKIKDKINLIPVKDSNWVLGMYDTINKTFYTNAGTGTFTAWPSLYPSIDNPVKILTNNWALKLINTLPDGYSQLEYLESSWTQAINTWIYDVDRIETEFKSKYNRQYTAMFASYNDENSLTTRMIWSNSWVALYYINSVAKAGRGCVFSQNTWHKVKLYEEGSNEVIDIDGTITSYAKVSWNPNTANIHLFANKNWVEGAPTAFKYFKAYKGGELIFDAVPVKRKTDNVLWMYDKVSWTFLTNVGTGAFTAWPEVEQEKKMVIDWLQETITDEIWNTATVENLFKIGEDYVDSQEILTGNITRKVWVMALDGSEEWGYESKYTRFYAPISNLKNVWVRLTPMICTHFININDGRGYEKVPNNAIFTGDISTNYVFIKMTEYTTLAAFKEFLANQYAVWTPVILLYPLAEETTESVESQTLSTVDGENTIRVSQSSMEWLELKMEYMLPWDSKINFKNPELLLPEWWNEWDILKIVNGVPTRVSPSS